MKTIILLACMLFLLSLPSCNKECAIPGPSCNPGYELNNKGACFCPKGKIEVANQCRKPHKFEWGNSRLNIPCYDHMYLRFEDSQMYPNDTTFLGLIGNPSATQIVYVDSDTAGWKSKYLANISYGYIIDDEFWIDFSGETFGGLCEIGGKNSRLIDMRLKQPHPDTLVGIARYSKTLFSPPILDVPVIFYRQR